MENYQAQPYDLWNTASNYAYNIQRCSDLCFIHRPRPKTRNFVNMVQIQEYQEGSDHTVQEGGSSSPSSTASNGSIHTELRLHDNEEVEYDLDTQTTAQASHDSHPSHQGKET